MVKRYHATLPTWTRGFDSRRVLRVESGHAPGERPDSSPPCHGGGCGFESRRGRSESSARCANWNSGQPQTLVLVGSTPTRATRWIMCRLALGCRADCKPAALAAQQVRFLPDALTARSSSGSGRQPLTLGTGVRFPHGSLEYGVRSGEFGVKRFAFIPHSSFRTSNSEMVM